MSAPTDRDEERELVARITSERDRRAQREDDAHAQRAAESHAQREDDALVDELAAMLRGAEPEVLSALQTDALIARATRRARIAPWVMPTLAMAAALLLAVAGGWWLHGGTVHGTLVPAPQSTTDSAVANRDEPLRATLPTGDRVAATPGAELQFVSLSRAERRIAVRRGEVLFDVLPLATGERFEVHTPHAIVRVRGTVFSVRAAGDHAEVRVYEGEVDVERDDGSHALLGAGEMLRSDRSETSAATAAALDVQGRAAAAVRIERARTARAEATRATPPVDAPAQPQGAGAAQATNVAAAGVEQPQGDGAALATSGANSEPTRAQPAVTPPATRAFSLDATRALLAAGNFAAALAAARAGAASSRTPAPWWLLEGDALRGLGRAEVAADAYDRAAAGLSPSEAAQAGFAAASLRFLTLGDSAGALRSLDAAHVDAPGSPLDERALGLRARALHRAGHLDEARSVARDYLARHPSGGLVSWMQALIDSEAPAPAAGE